MPNVRRRLREPSPRGPRAGGAAETGKDPLTDRLPRDEGWPARTPRLPSPMLTSNPGLASYGWRPFAACSLPLRDHPYGRIVRPDRGVFLVAVYDAFCICRRAARGTLTGRLGRCRRRAVSDVLTLSYCCACEIIVGEQRLGHVDVVPCVRSDRLLQPGRLPHPHADLGCRAAPSPHPHETTYSRCDSV